MSAKLSEMFGRTYHDFELLSKIIVGAVPRSPRMGASNAEITGYNKQRDKLIKALLKDIFRHSTKANPIHVKDCSFTVISNEISLTVPPGFIDVIYLSTFRENTTVIINSPFQAQFVNVGCPGFK